MRAAAQKVRTMTPATDAAVRSPLRRHCGISSQPLNWCASTFRFVMLLAATWAWLALPSTPSHAQTDTAVSSTAQCELRIVWGGPITRAFEGQISCSGGSLRVLRNLSLQPDSIGKLTVSNPSQIQLKAHSPATFGGADILVQGTSKSVLTLTFENPFGEQPVIHSVTLGELLDGNWLEPLDDRGTMLAIQRPNHDRIRIRSTIQEPIYAPQQSVDYVIDGNRTGFPKGTYRLSARLVSDSGVVADILAREVYLDADGSFEPINLSIESPAEAGVYRLEVELNYRRFLNSLITPSAIMIRRYEFVVFDDSRDVSRIVSWQPLVTLNASRASKPGMLSWLSPIDSASTIAVPDRWQQLNPLSGSLNAPLHKGQLGSRIISMNGTNGGSECLTLEPDAWLAIPIETLAADVPHRLRLRMPSDQPMRLAISVRHSHEQNDVAAHGHDYQFDLEPRSCRSGLSTYEVVFWPSRDTTYLLLANADAKWAASVLDIAIDQAQLGPMPSRSTQPAAADGRLAGIYIDKPLLAHLFSPPRPGDGDTGRRLEDWTTWDTASVRLNQYADWAGANLLILKVQADGSAIFPINRLDPSPRYDSGIFFSDGRSPQPKDTVDLLLRHCAAHGTKLILALDLRAALPGLSRWRGNSLQASLFQKKLTSDENTALHSTRYDPLNPKVQAEVENVIRDIVNRYSAHPAFAGLQLQLDSESQLLFAGDRWGFNDGTLRDFEAFTRAKLPPKDQLEAAFRSSLRTAFLAWRASELSKFFDRLGKIVNDSGEGRKLYLNATRLWEHPLADSDYYAPQQIIRSPTEYLLALGLDTQQLQESSHTVLMQGELQWDHAAQSSEDWIRQIAQQRGLTRAGNTDLSAAIVIRQPSHHHLSAAEELVSKFGASAETVFPIRSGTEASKRRATVEQLYQSDVGLVASGTWLPPTDQVSALRELRRTIREFPPIRLDDFPLRQKKTNVRLRSGRFAEKTFVQVVNNSPWVEEIAMTVRFSGDSAPPRILGDRVLDMARTTNERDDLSGQEIWRFQIPPFDVVGIEADHPQFQIVDALHAPPQGVVGRVAGELATLESLLSRASDPTQQPQLANLFGDFEQWTTDGRAVGWNVSSLPGVHIGQAMDLPRSGRSSLVIENSNAGNVAAWIQSQPVRPPSTGRLALRAWLRCPSTTSAPIVRLAITGRTRIGNRFERVQEVGGSQRPIANDWGTRPATFFVVDVPSEELDEIFVTIELVGVGTVWVDDVEVLETWLHPNESTYLQGLMFVAKQKLAENNPFPAEQLLDSHWGRYLGRFNQWSAAERTSPAAPVAITPERVTPTQEAERRENAGFFQQFRESMRERWRR